MKVEDLNALVPTASHLTAFVSISRQSNLHVTFKLNVKNVFLNFIVKAYFLSVDAEESR